jgi:putative tryptophan/tyrosine transport system substrate-binding protein
MAFLVSSSASPSSTEIETVITSLGREPGGGLVVMPDTFVESHRAHTILLAAGNNVPTVYPESVWARDGGLVSYGPNRADIFVRSSAYVDRILRGAKPADLPVQAPTKYELVVNLKTARTLGLELPPTVLARADEAIE